MPILLNIPRIAGGPLTLPILPGETVYLLGPNGAGKSALMHKLFRDHSNNSQIISAHRQTWFESNFVTLSPQQKRATENNILSFDAQEQGRWMDNFGGQRAGIAIFDLVDAENIRARSIAGAVDNHQLELAQQLSKMEAPIKVINELLRLSSMNIEIAVRGNDEVVAKKGDSAEYSIARLSDGERGALFIAAKVLTGKDGALFLIDEPERHLHRSIIAPLLTLLFAKRPDCGFVISTHDFALPLDHLNARTILVRECNASITAWNVDSVPSGAELDDEIKTDILGARRRILFVEGTNLSLDKPLYSVVFPQVSVIAKNTCRNVQDAVTAVRDSEDLHWLHAFGVIDSDGRSTEEVNQLRERGVYALPVFTIESIYYHPEVQRRVAERYAQLDGGDASARITEAKAAALEAATPHIDRLTVRVVEKALREQIMGRLPRRADIAAGGTITLSIDVGATVDLERTRFQNAINAGDLEGIITRYPVRETAALGQIAHRLGFQNRDQYESAVRKLLMDDPAALDFVKGLFGPLTADLEAA